MARRVLLFLGLVVIGAAVVLVGGTKSASPGGPGACSRPRRRDPSYWPTAGWRTASPASQGMDGTRLDAMLAEIREREAADRQRHRHPARLRRARRRLRAFAAGNLGEPYASGRLHELQSATKSVTSMLLGIALHEQAATGVTVKTPVLRLAAAVHYVPEHTDARKRAMTLEDMLTMQSGLAWKESGYAYGPGSGNDVMAMLATRTGRAT